MIIEFLSEIFVRVFVGVIVEFLGVNTRYFFLKPFRKNLKKKSLHDNDLLNGIVGFGVLCLLGLLGYKLYNLIFEI